MWLLTISEQGQKLERKVVASLELENKIKGRTKGLIGRDEINGAMLITPLYLAVHTFGVKFPLDIAFLDSNFKVLKIKPALPKRLVFCWKSRAVLEAPIGSFEKWGIVAGMQLEIEGDMESGAD